VHQFKSIDPDSLFGVYRCPEIQTGEDAWSDCSIWLGIVMSSPMNLWDHWKLRLSGFFTIKRKIQSSARNAADHPPAPEPLMDCRLSFRALADTLSALP
jgi:hypothetical protein